MTAQYQSQGEDRGYANPKSNLGESGDDDKTTVRGAAAAAAERLKADARKGSEAAKERIAEFADEQKDTVSESLAQFAQAVAKASDELRGKDQTLAAQLVREAADGLGHLSRSIGGSTPQDLLHSVRRFGRDNPLAFVGGAVLAGVALGRFARAEPRRRSTEPGRENFRQEDEVFRQRSFGSEHRNYGSGSEHRSYGSNMPTGNTSSGGSAAGFEDSTAISGTSLEDDNNPSSERTIP